MLVSSAVSRGDGLSGPTFHALCSTASLVRDLSWGGSGSEPWLRTPPPRSPGADMRSPAEITFRPAGALFTHGDDVLPPQGGGGARPAGEAVDTLAGTSLRSVCDDLETGDGFAAIFAAADAADCDRKQLEQLWAEHDKALALVTKARSESEEDESSGAIESAARNLDELKRAIERLQAGRAKVVPYRWMAIHWSP